MGISSKPICFTLHKRKLLRWYYILSSPVLQEDFKNLVVSFLFFWHPGRFRPDFLPSGSGGQKIEKWIKLSLPRGRVCGMLEHILKYVRGQADAPLCLEVSTVLNKIPWKKVLLVLYIVLVVLSVLVVGVFLYLKFGVHPPDVDKPSPPVVTNTGSGNESPAPDESESQTPEPVSDRRKETYTCLIFGEDAVSGSTDTIMVATFDVPNKQIGLVSVPRDTKVRTDLGQASCKVNAAYALGGPDQLKRELNELLGIPIDFYVKIRLTAFQRLVDQIGGVWFEVPFHMKYKDPTQNLVIDQPAGYRKLTGEDAMEVVRFRQTNFNDSFGDTGRAGVQQAFLKAMLSQAISNATIADIPGLVDILLNYVDTDATINDMIYFGQSLIGMDIDSAVTTATLSAKWINPFMIVEDEAALETINELLNPYKEDITMDMVEFLK